MSRSRNSGGRMSMFEEKMEVSRRLLEKDRFQQHIKDVHEFLLGLGFPGTINAKSLQSTAPEDFHLFNSFAFHFSGSFYQFPPNVLEEEIPKLLKDLRYPVALSKRYMCSVGHIPMRNLGGVWLQWLEDWILNCQIVNMMCLLKAKKLSSLCDVEEGAEFNEPLMEYCRDTYRKFLEGTDSIEEKDEALLNQLLKGYKVDKQRFISAQEKHRMSMEYVERMERECQNRLKREGIPAQHILEMSNVFTPEVIQEMKMSHQEDQSLRQHVGKILQRLTINSDSHTELEENGAAGVERGGAKTRKSRKGKKVKRRQRK